MVVDVAMVVKPLILRLYERFVLIVGYKGINNLSCCYNL